MAVFNGYSVEEHVGAHISEIIPQIQGTIEPILCRVLETGEPELGFEVSGVSPENPTRVSDFLVSYHPVKNDAGQVTGVSFIVQDVTELKQAKTVLRQSEEQVRLLLNSTAEAIYGLDLNGECTFCNPACVRILGYENREQLLGKNMHELIHHTRADGTRYPMKDCRIYEAFRRSEGLHVDDEVLWRADGTSFLAEYWSHPIRHDIEVIGAVVTFLDVSNRRKAEKFLRRSHDELEERARLRTSELTQSEERWRSLVDTAPDLILIIDLDGTLRYINRTEQGYKQEDVIGTCAYDYLTPEHCKEMIDAVRSVIETGESVSFQTSATGVDGSVEWYQTRLGPFREDGEIVGITSIATNISPQKSAEKRLQDDQKLLRRLIILQENERRMVAHDIHDGFVQDVVGALMLVQSISYRFADLDGANSILEDAAAYLQKAISEGRRLIRDLRPMVLDEAGLVESLAHLIADQMSHSNLTIAFEHDVQFDRLEPTLEGAIFRIVQESLNNVLQHSQGEYASVQLTQIDHELRIIVRDRGVGFDPKQVPSDRFGLRGICERARLFGGTAVIKSVPGEGTIVKAQLPITPQPDAQPSSSDSCIPPDATTSRFTPPSTPS
ncbi:MAG: PAS domain S-box protein [Planctomycetales bacterium]